MSAETLAALHRLKRVLGKERARMRRFAMASHKEGHVLARDRADSGASALSFAMGCVDAEIRRARTDSPQPAGITADAPAPPADGARSETNPNTETINEHA